MEGRITKQMGTNEGRNRGGDKSGYLGTGCGVGRSRVWCCRCACVCTKKHADAVYAKKLQECMKGRHGQMMAHA